MSDGPYDYDEDVYNSHHGARASAGFFTIVVLGVLACLIGALSMVLGMSAIGTIATLVKLAVGAVGGLIGLYLVSYLVGYLVTGHVITDLRRWFD